MRFSYCPECPKFGVVADFALQRHVADEADIGLGIDPRKVAGVGVAVGIPVGDVEQEDNVVAVGERGHSGASSAAGLSALRKNSLRWW